MADTNDIREEFSPLLDDELSPDARDAVERDLAQDSELLRELHAMRKVDELYRGLPRASAPADLAARVQNQLSGKSNVAPMRRRRIPVALYSGLAAAAMFTVLVGGVVIRQEYFVSPTGEERALQAVQSEAIVEGESTADFDASTPPMPSAPGDAPDVASPSDAAEASAPQPLGQAMEPDDATQVGVRFRQISADDVESPGRVREQAGGKADSESKDELAEMTRAEEAAPAPPPPPEANAGRMLGRAANPVANAPVPVAAAPEEDSRDFFNDNGAMQKRSNRVERIAERDFEQRNDGWYQRGYEGEETKVVRRGSEALTALKDKVDEFETLLLLEGDIVFRIDDDWYRIPAKAVEQP